MSVSYEPSGSLFVDSYVDYAMTALGDGLPYAHQLMALGVLSALAGPRVRIPIISAEGMNLCLWVCYVVNSTVGRKTKTLDTAENILRAVLGDDALVFWEGSPQGFIQKLQERDSASTVLLRDEMSGLLQQMGQKGGYMAGLAKMFIRCYDSKPIDNIKTKKGPETGSDRVRMPYLVMITAAVWDEFIKYADSAATDVNSGFLPRFIFYTGAVEPRPMQRFTEASRSRLNALIALAGQFRRNAGQLEVGGIDVDQDLLDEHFATVQGWVQSAADNPQTQTLYTRLGNVGVKIAGLFAIEEAKDRIERSDLERAMRLLERWRDAGATLIGRLGETEFQRDTRTVWELIAGSPGGITHRDLCRQLRSRFDRKAIKNLLGSLIDREVIQMEERQTGGRPTIVYVARAF